ncbi:hypothetical protein Taro_017022 [Colocasia esculenta]|uniref:Uncharacterized protein n=1 Tax=Colocasia esculenta TaxID=4460 RepID=A0A843UMF8_COLES|nr:hypothetical protein [Colocasia esculenta]
MTGRAFLTGSRVEGPPAGRRCYSPRHRVQELTAEIALAEQRFEALRSRRGGAISRVESLRASHSGCHAVSSRLAECEAASLGLAEGVAAAEAELTAVERECADSQAALSALQASDLLGASFGTPPFGRRISGTLWFALGIFCLNFAFLAFIKHLIQEFGVEAGLFGLGSTTDEGGLPLLRLCSGGRRLPVGRTMIRHVVHFLDGLRGDLSRSTLAEVVFEGPIWKRVSFVE